MIPFSLLHFLNGILALVVWDILSLCFHLCPDLQSGLLPSGFRPRLCTRQFFVSLRPATWPYVPSVGHPNYTLQKEQFTKLCIMGVFQSSCSSLLGLDILLTILFPNILSTCSSLYGKDQVSYP